jgi:hypothetical protein
MKVRLTGDCDLKDVFTYASDALEGKHMKTSDQLIKWNFTDDDLACIVHRFHVAVAVYFLRTAYFVKDETESSPVKYFGKSLLPTENGFVNLNQFSNSVLYWFRNSLNSIND